MDGSWIDGWMDGWMDGWIDGWMDGWIGGWVDRRKQAGLVAGRREKERMMDRAEGAMIKEHHICMG